MRRIRARSTLAAAVLLLAGACGGDGAANGATAGAGRIGYGGATGATAPAAGGGMGDMGGGGAEGGLTVQVSNFLFAPSDIEAAAGSTISVRNGNPSTPHTFTVQGTDVDVELAPLASQDVTLDLAPGAYDVICRFHGQMTASLTVA